MKISASHVEVDRNGAVVAIPPHPRGLVMQPPRVTGIAAEALVAVVIFHLVNLNQLIVIPMPCSRLLQEVSGESAHEKKKRKM